MSTSREPPDEEAEPTLGPTADTLSSPEKKSKRAQGKEEEEESSEDAPKKKSKKSSPEKKSKRAQGKEEEEEEEEEEESSEDAPKKKSKKSSPKKKSKRAQGKEEEEDSSEDAPKKKSKKSSASPVLEEDPHQIDLYQSSTLEAQVIIVHEMKKFAAVYAVGTPPRPKAYCGSYYVVPRSDLIKLYEYISSPFDEAPAAGDYKVDDPILYRADDHILDEAWKIRNQSDYLESRILKVLPDEKYVVLHTVFDGTEETDYGISDASRFMPIPSDDNLVPLEDVASEDEVWIMSDTGKYDTWNRGLLKKVTTWQFIIDGKASVAYSAEEIPQVYRL